MQTTIEKETVEIAACPHPFKTDRVDIALPHGLTVYQMLEEIQPDPILRRHGHVFIGDQYIHKSLWMTVRPKPKTRVTIRVVPSDFGGGGEKIHSGSS